MAKDWTDSAQAWIDFVDRGNGARTYLLDPAMLDLAGDLAGKRVLDVGCGEGRFARMLQARGADVVGLDPAVPLLTEAARRGTSKAVVASGEALPFASDSFDSVVTYLSLIDIPDYRRAIREMARVLQPRGKLLVANLNPFATTMEPSLVKGADGKLLYMKVMDYFGERPEWVEWCGIRVINWHRPLSDYIAAFLESGLILKHYGEPVPQGEKPEDWDGWEASFSVPFFHTMLWEKPE